MKSLRNLLTAVAIAALTTACAQVPKLTTELPTGWLKDQNGCAVYHSPGQQNDSVRWSGKCKNGYAEGSGITEWYAYGGLLETDTVPRKRGKLHGSGVVTWWDAGDHYIGATTNDLRDGKGVYVWNNGEIYEGDWVADNRTGHGTLILTNGDRYEGGWVDDMWSGQGTYTTATGRIFQGNINRDNLADSEGTITEP
ncbi:MAG: hypothetical protein LBV44_09635, partial [Methylobacillus sp.]|nr:hypothetical protein [Methylobacillus sp.]